MRTIVETGTSSYSVILENGEQVYPCRCGVTHRGPYAIYDYGHHTCGHPSPLIWCWEGQVMCGECGQVFGLEDKREEIEP